MTQTAIQSMSLRWFSADLTWELTVSWPALRTRLLPWTVLCQEESSSLVRRQQPGQSVEEQSPG